MDIEYKGGNCVVFTTKKATLVVDPKLSTIGLKDQAGKADAQLATQADYKVASERDKLVIDGPGEYEVENISIKGIAALAHVDPKGSAQRATIYCFNTGDISVAVVGHIHPELTEEQLEAIGVVDVLVVPVGGNGYTLDATGAIQVVRAIDPKMVIPTHYADAAVNYPVPQAELAPFIKELGAPVEETSKLKLKAGNLAEALTVYDIKRT